MTHDILPCPRPITKLDNISSHKTNLNKDQSPQSKQNPTSQISKLSQPHQHIQASINKNHSKIKINSEEAEHQPTHTHRVQILQNPRAAAAHLFRQNLHPIPSRSNTKQQHTHIHSWKKKTREKQQNKEPSRLQNVKETRILSSSHSFPFNSITVTSFIQPKMRIIHTKLQ